MGITEKLSARDTPAGRQYELRLIFWDVMVLCIGCVALALDFLPALAVVALIHLVIGALQAISRVVWLIGTVVTTAVLMAVLVGFGFLIEWQGWGSTQFADLSPRGLVVTAIYAVVVGGILESLFAYPGTVDELIEHKNKQ